MEEMLEDTFESMEDGEDMEEEAEEEVDKILFEITAGEKMCSAVQFHYVCLRNMYPKSSGSELQLVDLCHKQISLTAFYHGSLVSLGALGKAPVKVTDALPEMEPSGAMAASDEETEEDIEEMQSRLAALRS